MLIVHCFIQTATFGGFGTTGTGLFGNTAKSTTGTSVFQTPGQTSTFGTATSTGFGTTGKFLYEFMKGVSRHGLK